jgi:gas vesicle protein
MESNTDKVLLALLLGIAGGAALAMLLASENGAEIRKKIADAANDFTESLQDIPAQMKGGMKTGPHNKEAAWQEIIDYITE